MATYGSGSFVVQCDLVTYVMPPLAWNPMATKVSVKLRCHPWSFNFVMPPMDWNHMATYGFVSFVVRCDLVTCVMPPLP